MITIQKIHFLLFCFCSFFLFAQEELSPWYSGPLVTESAENVGPGIWNINPYIYLINTHKPSASSSSDEWSMQNYLSIERGFTKWLDVTLLIINNYNTLGRYTAFKWADPIIKLGLQLVTQKKGTMIPSLRFRIYESFPLGKYKNLNPDKSGIDGVGAGGYITSFGLNASKIVYWFPMHPMSLRGNFLICLPTKAHVNGFNSYGGGYNTKGKVKPGKFYYLDFSCEYSLTQRWVLVLELLYSHYEKNTFSGTKGIAFDGSEASSSAPYKWILEIAPEIEYNFAKNLGLVLGGWFTAARKNYKKTQAGGISLIYTF